MGTAFARLLHRRGFGLSVYARRPEASAPLHAELDSASAASPAALADGSDILLGCLRDLAAIEETYFGPAGLTAATRPVIVVELSTLGPDQVAKLQARVIAAGHGFVYAAAAGLPMDVAAGRALLLVAGAEPAVAAALPVLSVLGRVKRIGFRPDAAATLKLAMNMMVFSSICGISEALLAAERSGIARDVAFDLLADSSILITLPYRRPSAWQPRCSARSARCSPGSGYTCPRPRLPPRPSPTPSMPGSAIKIRRA